MSRTFELEVKHCTGLPNYRLERPCIIRIEPASLHFPAEVITDYSKLLANSRFVELRKPLSFDL